jgi:DNA-directed RNA polymerase specialized sigma24 family protein
VNVIAGPGKSDSPGPKLPLAMPVCGGQAGGRHPGPAGPRSAQMGCRGQPTALGHRLEVHERPEDHLDRCLECRAALTACLREGCRSAEDAFTPIVNRAAFGALKNLGVDVHTVRGQDLLSEALGKGWDLLLRGQKCAPQKVLTGTQKSLGGYLYRCMRNKVIDQLKKERNPELSLDELDQMPAAVPLVDDGVVDADQEKLLGLIIADYGREQAAQASAVRAKLFEVWLEERLRPTRFRKPPSQEEVAELVTAALGQPVDQTRVSRQFSKFQEELLARIVAAPEIDDHTRRLAQQLFAEGRRPRRKHITRGDGGT